MDSKFYNECKEDKYVEVIDKWRIFRKITFSMCLLVFIYFISSHVLGGIGIYFRSWLGDIISFIVIILIVLGGGAAFYKSCSNNTSVFARVILGIVLFIMTGFILCITLFGIILSSTTTTMAYRDGELVIAESDGFLNSTVDFYKPINIFLMKDSKLESFSYDGGMNIYSFKDIGEDFEKTDGFDLNSSSYLLLSLQPYRVNKKFGGIKYLGSDTYSFNHKVTMKFSHDETRLSEMSIKSDIAIYDGIKIVGNNIETFKKSMENKMKVFRKTVMFEKNKNGYEVAIYSNGYYAANLRMNLIVNSENIITELKISSFD